jgi:hypothetical protein
MEYLYLFNILLALGLSSFNFAIFSSLKKRKIAIDKEWSAIASSKNSYSEEFNKAKFSIESEAKAVIDKYKEPYLYLDLKINEAENLLKNKVKDDIWAEREDIGSLTNMHLCGNTTPAIRSYILDRIYNFILKHKKENKLNSQSKIRITFVLEQDSTTYFVQTFLAEEERLVQNVENMCKGISLSYSWTGNAQKIIIYAQVESSLLKDSIQKDVDILLDLKKSLMEKISFVGVEAVQKEIENINKKEYSSEVDKQRLNSVIKDLRDLNI